LHAANWVKYMQNALYSAGKEVGTFNLQQRQYQEIHLIAQN
jgi:hypothetical protein